MASAEPADGVEDPVFLSEGLSVYGVAEILKVLFDLVVVHAVHLLSAL